jgi:SAM-dependent methyltransferase
MINKHEFDGNLKYGGKTFFKESCRDIVTDKVNSSDWAKEYYITSNNRNEPNLDYFDQLTNCPCCNMSDHQQIICKNGLSVSRCNDCGFGFQNPRFKKDKVSELYKDVYVMNDVYSSDVGMELDKIKFQYGIQKACLYKTDINKTLDIGCGVGYSLVEYQKCGIQNVIGIDPGKYEGHNIDVNIYNCMLDEIPKELNNISLITMWDVLEHIHDFNKIIESVYESLEVNGLLLIMVPNLLSLATRLIRENSPTFCIDHLNYFTENSLSLLLEKNKFTIVMKETVISELDNCRNYLEFQTPYDSSPNREKAFNWLDADYIHNNMLGSRLLFIARKIN